MNSPACPNCGNPLDPSMTACPRCGMPVGAGVPGPAGAAGQQHPTQQLPAQQNPAQGGAPDQYGAAAAYAGAGQFGNQAPPGQGPGAKKKPWLIPLIAGIAVLLIAGIVVAAVLLTGGDDDDDKRGTDEPSTGQSNEPSTDTDDGPTDEPADPPTTDEPTDPPTTDEPTDPPTTDGPTDPPVSPSGTMDRRTAPTGSDQEQLKQLEADLNAWFNEVYSGDLEACAAMDQFFLDVDADSIQGCQESAGFLDGQTVDFEMTNIEVTGDTATVTMKTTIAGETDETDDVELVKRDDGYWMYKDD